MTDYFENSVFDVLMFYKFFGPSFMVANIAGIYIIYQHSPDSMGAYKFHLIVHSVCGIFFELCMTVLLCPRIYTPYFMGSTHGVLTTWFEMDVFYQQLIGWCSVQLLLSSVGQMVIYRTQALLLPSSEYKLSARGLNVAIVSFYLLINVPGCFIHFFSRRQQNGMENARVFIEAHPEYPSLLENNGSLYLEQMNLWTGVAHVSMLLYFFILMVCGILPLYCFTFFHVMSNRSIANRRRSVGLALALGVQMVPVIVCYMFPALWFALTFFTGVLIPQNQVLNDVGCALAALQSCISIILLMFLVKPYRQYLGGKFRTVTNLPFDLARNKTPDVVHVKRKRETLETSGFYRNAMQLSTVKLPRLA